MIFKGFLIILCVSSVLSYQKEGNVLVLKDADFPQVINKHQYIFVKFYAQWCHHCQELAPHFTEVADQFAAKGSQIIFGRVECSQNENVPQMYEIEGFPKLVLFRNNERIDYDGQRTKLHIANWLNKVLNDPLQPIDEQTYKSLEDSDQQAVVFHGKSSSVQAHHLRIAACKDFINKYYIADVGKQQNTIELFRPIDPTLTHNWIDQNVLLWIRNNQRPLVRNFDDSAISMIFQQGKIALCLFNDLEAEWLDEAFRQSAKRYLKTGKQILFVNVEKYGGDYKKFGNQFLRIDPQKIALVLINPDTGDGSKFVLIKDPESLTVYDIMKFLQDWQGKKTKRYDLPSEIQEIKNYNLDMKGQNAKADQKDNDSAQQTIQNNEL